MIIVALFAVQRVGTAKVGRSFGPVMVLWFISIGFAGVVGIAAEPGVRHRLSFQLLAQRRYLSRRLAIMTRRQFERVKPADGRLSTPLDWLTCRLINGTGAMLATDHANVQASGGC